MCIFCYHRSVYGSIRWLNAFPVFLNLDFYNNINNNSVILLSPGWVVILPVFLSPQVWIHTSRQPQKQSWELFVALNLVSHSCRTYGPLFIPTLQAPTSSLLAGLGVWGRWEMWGRWWVWGRGWLKGQVFSIGTGPKIVFSVVSNYKWWASWLINPFLSALGRPGAPE